MLFQKILGTLFSNDSSYIQWHIFCKRIFLIFTTFFGVNSVFELILKHKHHKKKTSLQIIKNHVTRSLAVIESLTKLQGKKEKRD